jgi:hypothetical protein
MQSIQLVNSLQTIQPENCENPNDPDLVQAFLKKRWARFQSAKPPALITVQRLRLYGSNVIFFGSSVYLFGPKVCFLAQMVCHLKEKRKAVLHSLTQSYVTVLI